MRERLIELILEGMRKYHTDGKQYLRESIADYLLANGVIIPPCKVGDTVYVIPTKENGMSFIEPREITYILDSGRDKSYCSVDLNYKLKGFKSKDYSISEEMFDKTVFLTREEAEQALKGGESL